MARSRSRSRSRSVSPTRQGRVRDQKHKSRSRRRSKSRDRRDYYEDDRDRRYSRGDPSKPRHGRRSVSPRRHRSRSRSPYQTTIKKSTSRSRSRSRSRHRYRSRDRHDSRTRENISKKTGPISSSSNNANHSNVAKNADKSEMNMEKDLEGSVSEEQEMLKLMGFGNFNSTKGKQVPGNNVSAVHVIHKRKYRQYMNRKGGFNRPLDFVA